MCGICGALDLDGQPASTAVLRRMTETLAHRGPDGQGFYTHQGVGFGHRRLAILDPTPAGHQPMMTGDRRFVITYNGEVYNFRELRVELEAAGRQFHSDNDAEVVLNAYAEWGETCLERLNGMFAFAIWDRQEHELLLARDRYGIKPLYLWQQGRTLLFASEIKALLAHPEARAVLDPAALVEYFTFQNLFSQRTLFQNVALLPAGCTMRVRQGQATVPEPSRYWDYDFREPEHPADEEAYLEELDRLFRAAVSRNLVSDVEIGAYLSGGMDSGSITAIAAGQLPYLKTFTCGFDLSSASGLELGFDERAKAEAMSYLFKTEHYEVVLKSGDMERVLPQLTRHLEDPRVGQCYPNYYVAQLASKFVKVVLSGGGGDEMFGGYPWRYYRAASSGSFDEYIDSYYAYWQRLVPEELAPEIFRPIRTTVAGLSTRDIFRSVFRHHDTRLEGPEGYINHSLYFEAKTFLHGLLLVEDKLSMAHGLETRVPFLDNDLVDFAMRLPVRLKLRHLTEVSRPDENEPGPKSERYFTRTRDGKLLLRRAMERYVPQAVTSRAKQGFAAPDASWFKGDSIDYVQRRLLAADARLFAYLDRDTVRKLVGEHLEGKANRRLLIWSLLNFEQWCECFL